MVVPFRLFEIVTIDDGLASGILLPSFHPVTLLYSST